MYNKNIKESNSCTPTCNPKDKIKHISSLGTLVTHYLILDTYLLVVIYQILPGSMHQWHKLFPIPDHETQQSFAQERSLLELHLWVTRKISDLGIHSLCFISNTW